jgi:hypothetical protein
MAKRSDSLQTDLMSDAIMIAQYLYDNKHTAGDGPTVADLRKASGLTHDNFDSAAQYLSQRNYIQSTLGGEQATCWLTPQGVEFVHAHKSRANIIPKKSWAKEHWIALIGLILTMMAILVAVYLPEIRVILGLPSH